VDESESELSMSYKRPDDVSMGESKTTSKLADEFLGIEDYPRQ
jgi:hypothetical protein